MATTGMRKQNDPLTAALEGMLTRANTVQAYLNRVVWRQYQDAQQKRWITENSSEGASWKKLTPAYEKRKKTIYASFPGAGNALMVATGKLSSGAMGRDSQYFYKEVTSKGMKVYVNRDALPYAAYVAEDRPYMEFGQDTMNTIVKGLGDFMIEGKE